MNNVTGTGILFMFIGLVLVIFLGITIVSDGDYSRTITTIEVQDNGDTEMDERSYIDRKFLAAENFTNTGYILIVGGISAIIIGLSLDEHKTDDRKQNLPNHLPPQQPPPQQYPPSNP